MMSGGVTWSADQYFNGGKSFTNTFVSSIAGTTDDVLYRTERSATSDLDGFSYTIPVPVHGTYTVRLHFAEIWFGAPGGGPAGAGRRVFSATFPQGSARLLDYDIFAEVGAVTATVKTFAVEVLNGVLRIDFSAKIDQPKLSAVEVIFPTSSSPSESKVLRINAGGPAVTTGGQLWAEDQFYSGGKSFVNNSVTAVAGTADDILYVTERSSPADLGGFSYAIPAPTAGDYLVRLHFAEIWFGAPGGGPGGSGRRVFSVNIEGGSSEVVNYDIVASVGSTTATVKEFLVEVKDGVINIDFSATVDQPKISAIEVVYPPGVALPPTTTATAWPSQWQPGQSAPAGCFEAAGTALSGKIYRVGGFNERYEAIRSYSSFDPAANRWTTLGTLPAAMAETHLGISNDGRFVYFAGGFSGNLNHNESPSQDINSNVYRFDPLTNTFTLIATLPQPRGAGTLDVLNGELHYMGGNPADRVTNVGDHFVYNLANKSWRTAAPLPNPKDHMSSLVLAGKIYVLGGEHGHDQLHLQQGDAHVYDPGTDRWTQIANLPTPKSHTEAGTFVSDGKIIMAGGQVDNFQPTSQVVAFDPLLNSWSVLPALPAPRQGAIIQRVDKNVIIALGGVQTSEPQSNVWFGKLP
ncbi:hypothetical protein J7I92_09445 [Arthrobacter sp. ISL-72]|nr:hypothetical protein [Arthrobacter sp. ISL-72]